MSKAYKVGGALKGRRGPEGISEPGVGQQLFLVPGQVRADHAFQPEHLPGPWAWSCAKNSIPCLLGECGPGCLFGKGVSLRHPKKIRLGAGVVVDENAMLDAKGEDNRGLTLGDGVYIGRNCIVYTKGGDIELADQVNVSHNCELFSSNCLKIGKGCFIAAYSYLLSGGEYDIESPGHLSLSSRDTNSRGPTILGENVWIAAHVVVADGSVIGDHAVIGAGAVVLGEVPDNVLAAGVPCQAIRMLDRKP
jgi:acetyltransferase-like isoleucine patch superfamily enzyme